MLLFSHSVVSYSLWLHGQCMCSTQDQSPSWSLLPFPCGNYNFVCYICDSICILSKLICTIFFLRFHIYVIAYGICLYMASFSMTISRSIHVTTNGIVLCFLWLINIPLYIFATSSSTTIGNSMEIPETTKTRATIWCSSPTPRQHHFFVRILPLSFWNSAGL